MPDPSPLLEAEDALHELITQLETLKSASEQLSQAGLLADTAIRSADQVARLSAQVLEQNSRQFEVVTGMAGDSSRQFATIIQNLDQATTKQDQTLGLLDALGRGQEQLFEKLELLAGGQKQLLERMDESKTRDQKLNGLTVKNQKLAKWSLGLNIAALVSLVAIVVLEVVILSWVMVR